MKQKKKKDKTHDVEQSSNKDEVEKSSSNENDRKGSTVNDKTSTEGGTADSQDDEVEDVDKAQNEEEMDQIQ